MNWDTLWTDPHPPIESGLVKRPPNGNHIQGWDDLGSTWDDLVGSEVSDDEFGWASDGDAPLYERRRRSATPSPTITAADPGPLGEVGRPAPTRRETDMTVQIPQKPETQAETSRGSSPTSSSDDTPIVTQIERMALQNPKRASTSDLKASAQEPRGRRQTTYPVQGNGPAVEVD